MQVNCQSFGLYLLCYSIISFMKTPEAPVVIVVPEVGLGHYAYGMATQDQLRVIGVDSQWISIPDATSGLVSHVYWRLARSLYERGGRGGNNTRVYQWIRERQIRDSTLLKLGQRELRRALADYDGVVVSTHAHTAVRGRGPLVLVQGDILGGDDYANQEADMIVVPTEISRQELIDKGLSTEKVRTVGFFVDRTFTRGEITERQIREKRIDQLALGPVHVGIFFTGALPRPNIDFVANTLLPSLDPLMKRGEIQVTLYTCTSQKLAEAFLNLGQSRGWDLQVIYGKTPREAIQKSLAVLNDPQKPITVLGTRIGERLGWAYYIPLIALPPIPYLVNAWGANTDWGVKHGLFPDPSKTADLAHMLAKEGRYIFVEQMRRGQELIDPHGAKNTARIIKSMRR